jgi:hypothetical protein
MKAALDGAQHNKGKAQTDMANHLHYMYFYSYIWLRASLWSISEAESLTYTPKAKEDYHSTLAGLEPTPPKGIDF